MARYLLVEIDENSRADKLMDKLDGVPGIRLIALWFKPTTFCECEGPWENSIRGKKFGIYLCPECKLPRAGGPHQRPLNLLEPGVPETMQNVFLSIREPYQTPQEMHGIEAINKRIIAIRKTKQVIAQYMKRKGARLPRRQRARRIKRGRHD